VWEDDLPETWHAGPSTAAERRDHPKLIRYSASELAIVIQRARDCGRPVARFIRESSLGAGPRARRSHMNDQLIQRLAETATCLQRLSVEAKESQLPTAADFDNATREVLDFIRLID
jgi:mobilization protein NikA